jgi:hypothetical protein
MKDIQMQWYIKEIVPRATTIEMEYSYELTLTAK